MKKKVLLVEDNEKLAVALSLRLNSMGYTLINANSVSTAISSVVARKPDVSLIDINLPDGTGFMLAEQIEKNPNAVKTPIIFITASKNRTFRKQAMLYEPVAFLQKPFDASELIDAIEFAQYAFVSRSSIKDHGHHGHGHTDGHSHNHARDHGQRQELDYGHSRRGRKR